MMFRWSSGAYFPLWKLVVGGKEVATVSRKVMGAGALVFFEDERSLKNSLALLSNRLVFGLHYLCVHQIEIPILAILLLGFVLVAWRIRRLKKAK